MSRVSSADGNEYATIRFLSAVEGRKLHQFDIASAFATLGQRSDIDIVKRDLLFLEQ